MKEHPSNIEGFENLKELAIAVEDMRYDSLAEFLMELKNALDRRAASDKAAGRTKLASQLNHASRHLLSACSEVHGAWSICKPHMK